MKNLYLHRVEELKMLRQAAPDLFSAENFSRISQMLTRRGKALEDFTEEFSNCGFLHIERASFPEGREMFNSPSKVMTGMRMTFYSGQPEGDDITPKHEVMSLLMSDQQFANVTMGYSGQNAFLTLDRLGGYQMPRYSTSWREQADAHFQSRLTREDRLDLFRKAVAEARAHVEKSGYVPKREGEEILRSLESAHRNYYLDRDYALVLRAEQMQQMLMSQRIGMSAAVSHMDHILNTAAESAPQLTYDYSQGNDLVEAFFEPMFTPEMVQIGKEIYARFVAGLGELDYSMKSAVAKCEDRPDFKFPEHIKSAYAWSRGADTSRVHDILGIICERTSASNGVIAHSDDPHPSNVIRLSMNTCIWDAEEHKVQNFGDRRLLEVSIGATEMISAISGGAFGEMARCDITGIANLRLDRRYDSLFWSKMEGISEETYGGRITDNLAGKEQGKEIIAAVAEVLTAGAGGKKSMPVALKNLEEVERLMLADAEEILQRGYDVGAEIEDEIRDRMLKTIRRSSLLESYQKMTDQLQISGSMEP